MPYAIKIAYRSILSFVFSKQPVSLIFQGERGFICRYFDKKRNPTIPKIIILGIVGNIFYLFPYILSYLMQIGKLKIRCDITPYFLSGFSCLYSVMLKILLSPSKVYKVYECSSSFNASEQFNPCGLIKISL